MFDERDDVQSRYMLSLESRELRNQAQRLRKHPMETMTRELGYRMDSGAFMQFSGSPAR